MALANYTDLQASVAGWLKRADLTAMIPDFITLAESRIARDLRLRMQIATTNLTTVAGTQTVTLPSDWLETENITLMTNPPKSMSVVTPEILDVRFPAGYVTGEPRLYTYIGANLCLGPTPDAAYTIQLDYYQRFAALSATPTNTLLTRHPGIYLFATLHEAALYAFDEERAKLWFDKYAAEAQALQDQDDVSLRSGSEMRVRAL